MGNNCHYYQKTISKEILIQGHGLFAGEKTELKLKPLNSDEGIIFRRMDISHQPFIKKSIDNVFDASNRCTILGNRVVNIKCVEHLLSALYALGIDNLLIEVYGDEIPIMDGSSRYFVESIENAGIKILGQKKNILKLKQTIVWENGNITLVGLPSSEFKISYLLNYPKSVFLKSQYYSLILNHLSYKNQIAPSRTFSIYEEIQPLLESGLIKGGGLENAVIIKNDNVLNNDGLRFEEEMARHKILDLMGDLSLMNIDFLGHVIAIRSGHASNICFAKKFLKIIIKGDKYE